MVDAVGDGLDRIARVDRIDVEAEKIAPFGVGGVHVGTTGTSSAPDPVRDRDAPAEAQEDGTRRIVGAHLAVTVDDDARIDARSVRSVGLELRVVRSVRLEPATDRRLAHV